HTPGGARAVAPVPNLAEQGFTDVAARTRPGRDREEPTADVLDVLVQGIARRQPGLDRYEASPRIALEADEEETAVELARLAVDPNGERIAPAQEPDSAVRGGGGQAGMGTGGGGRPGGPRRGGPGHRGS